MKKLLLLLGLVGTGGLFAAAGGGGAAGGRSFAEVDREIQRYEKNIADDQKDIQSLQREIEGIMDCATYQNPVNLLPDLRRQLSAVPKDDDDQYTDIFSQIQTYEKTLSDFNEKLDRLQKEIALINRRVERESRQLSTLCVERDAAAIREGKTRVRVSIEEIGAESEKVFVKYLDSLDITLEKYIDRILGLLRSGHPLQQIGLEELDIFVNGSINSSNKKLKNLTSEELQNIRVQRKPGDWEAFE